MAGLFDIWGDSPQSQAELALAAGLLSGRGSFNSVLGQSLGAGQQAYSRAQANEHERALNQFKQRLLTAQIGETEAQTAERKANAEKAAKYQQPRFSALGGGNYMDVVTGEVFQGPQPPDKPQRPLRELGILEAMGVDPRSPQGQQMLRDSLVRPQAPANMQFIPVGPDGKIVGFNPRTGAATETGYTKPPTPANTPKPDQKAIRAFQENQASLRKIDEAIAAVRANPGAFGLQNFGGEQVNQRLDPRGVDARSKVANIGSLKRHERTGAAMSAAESPILRPFIPEMIDNPQTVLKKLENLRREIEITNESMSDAVPNASAPATPNAAAQPKRLRYNPATGNFE